MQLATKTFTIGFTQGFFLLLSSNTLKFVKKLQPINGRNIKLQVTKNYLCDSWRVTLMACVCIALFQKTKEYDGRSLWSTTWRHIKITLHLDQT